MIERGESRRDGGWVMSADTPVDIGSLIVSDPGFRGGEPCLAGTGMSVRAVAALYRDGQTAEAIGEDFPDIPRSHIHAAIAHYLANRSQIDADLKREARLYKRLAKEHPRKAHTG